MSLQKIIKESVEKNPLGLKEALEEELRNRVALALEAKMKEEDDYDDEDDDDDEDEVDEEAQPKWKVKIGKKTYTVTARNTAEANKKASALAKKEGNSGAPSGPIVKVQEEVELDEGTNILKKRGNMSLVTNDDDESLVVKKGSKKIATGFFDRNADGWFFTVKGSRGQKLFKEPDDVLDFFMKEEYDLDEASYNKDAVDKAISSADKKGKPTSSKGKELIHALLKGRSVKENLDEASRPVTKEAVIKVLIKRGNSQDQAKKMVEAEFDSAIKSWKSSSASKIADVISSTYGVKGVER
jgi:hypothetical protein